MTRYLSLAAVIALAVPAFAADPVEKLTDGAKVARIAVHPAKVDVTNPFAYAQLLVTAHLENGDVLDATRLAKVVAPKFVKVSAARQVRPAADGSGSLTISLAGKTVEVPLTVSGQKVTPTVNFVRDVEPAMSKMGCNAGTCHGAAQGKAGFKLSLRGYDPLFDHRSLTDDLEGRRFNRAAPERSLMLMKPAGAVPHVGGVTCSPGEPYYELLRSWIGDGVKLDLSTPRVTAIQVLPSEVTVPLPGMKQQYAVIATYADGSKRDVSAEAFVESSNTEVATVDKTGLMTAVRRGETTMLARYEGAYAASVVVVMGDRTGFAWAAPPRNNWIDELVDAKLQKMKILPSGLCDDSDFVRRVHIDLTGLPPTADEVRKFLADTRPAKQKRDELIDRLTGSEAFVDHWTNKWADLLQVNRKFLGDPGAKALRDWIKNAVATNMPYDKFARDVLTATGSNVANPPASYYKVLRTPDAVMENTTQLFLAIRFNCNKCHDHPFERWTQDQYYELAAYFAQVDRQEDPKYKGQKIGGTAVEKPLPLAEVIVDGKIGEVKHDRTGEVTAPKFPFTHAGLPAKTLPRRTQVADWITSKENPYFAKSYVNRIWSYLLGVGVIEPVDDIRAGNPPTNPELLDRLTKEFVASGFDTRKLIGTVCKSRTYQLSIATNKFNKDDEINYSHALPRRLPAEVLFDAIHRATGSAAKLPGLPAGARATQLLDSNVELPGGFLELFGKPARESACECERSNTMMLGSVMAMVNGPIIAEAIKDQSGHIAKFTAATPDDAKVVEEVYLSVLNRFPTAKEKELGVVAVRAADKDHATMSAAYYKRLAAYHEYRIALDEKQIAWEAGLRAQKPTEWVMLTPTRANSRNGATPAVAKAGATMTIQKDGSVLVSGKTGTVDIYNVQAEAKLKGAITAVRLEALADPSLPKKGPGRSENGNFVLNELRVQARPLEKADEKPKPVKLTKANATFEQGGFPAANAIDTNPASGWAIMGGVGKDQAAGFAFEKPVEVSEGIALTVVFDQRFGTNHTIGKFRLSVTTDPNPKLTPPVPPEVASMLAMPADKRTPEMKAKLRDLYLEQDKELARLKAETADPPPADPRVLGAQDLVWALINSPAFLFNH
ncbi:MAG TPA: DUF1549 domain-containing protein [Fimbriiglobus sp.]|nr:DUF1549 domain-containing protein [Fimbriiglobus sp.]